MVTGTNLDFPIKSRISRGSGARGAGLSGELSSAPAPPCVAGRELPKPVRETCLS